jgi:hypothetical protein
VLKDHEEFYELVEITGGAQTRRYSVGEVYVIIEDPKPELTVSERRIIKKFTRRRVMSYCILMGWELKDARFNEIKPPIKAYDIGFYWGLYYREPLIAVIRRVK